MLSMCDQRRRCCNSKYKLRLKRTEPGNYLVPSAVVVVVSMGAQPAILNGRVNKKQVKCPTDRAIRINAVGESESWMCSCKVLL